MRPLQTERPTPIGINCFLSPLDDGSVWVQSNNRGSVIQHGVYFGPGPFEVTMQPGGQDIVQVELPVTSAPEETEGDSTPPLLIWIPSISSGADFVIAGDPETLTLTAFCNILDSGLDPVDPALDYSLCDALTEFSIEASIDSDDHTWTDSSLPDNSLLTDPAPYDILVSSSEMTTTIRFKLRIDATNLLLYEVLYTYQFALTGSDPVSTTVVYVYPGSWLA